MRFFLWSDDTMQITEIEAANSIAAICSMEALAAGDGTNLIRLHDGLVVARKRRMDRGIGWQFTRAAAPDFIDDRDTAQGA